MGGTMNFPDNMASRIWEHSSMKFYLVPPSDWPQHYCGYVRFENRPVIEPTYHGIMTYVPVHGGITFANQDEDGSMIYGFDCGHAGDDERPELRDEEWLGEECFRMGRAIQIAAKYEGAYLATEGSKERAEVIQTLSR